MGKTLETWGTWVLLGALVLLVVTHPGGFSTDVTSGGKVLDQTVGLLGGVNNSYGVNYPTGTHS